MTTCILNCHYFYIKEDLEVMVMYMSHDI